MRAMDLVRELATQNKLADTDISSALRDIDSTHPLLEVAECAVAIGNKEIFEMVSNLLSPAERTMIELIVARMEGDLPRMLQSLDSALEIVRSTDSRDLILEGRLRMERGLISVQNGELDQASDDLEWSLNRLKSVSLESGLHGLAIINKAAYHEHRDEAMMALHLYGEIPLTSDFPPEIIGFSRVGAARIHAALGDLQAACRHLWNAHNSFTLADEYELAWHAGLEFLRSAHPFADPAAASMQQQSVDATPRQLGEETTSPAVSPVDLYDIACSLMSDSSIIGSAAEADVEFVKQIKDHCAAFEQE